jgi:group I intron endonuclease
MGIIYKITSPSNRIYVGQTNDFNKRLFSHKHSIKKKNCSHVILINSFKKHGFDEHIFEIIEECDDCLLDEKEIYWIKKLNTFNSDNPFGMNMTLGGEGQRGKLDERRKAIAINNLFKNGNPFKGKHHTEENKKLISKRTSEWNKKNGKIIPKWGAEKGRLKVIKPVLCYDLDGNFLMEFVSYTEAGKWLNKGVNIVRDAVKRKSCTLGKYFFVDKTENYPLKIETKGIAFANSKRKVLYLDSDLNIIKEYPSALEASEELKVPKTTINRAAQYNNLKPTRQGHIFYYSDKWNYY